MISFHIRGKHVQALPVMYLSYLCLVKIQPQMCDGIDLG
jgi:hypothetical protein